MKVTVDRLSPTKVSLKVSADANELASAKKNAVARLGINTKVPGFRAGKAPTHLLEKHLNQNLLQEEFLNQAVANIYQEALIQSQTRAVSQPEVKITKFVPFSTLEFSADVEAVGEIKLGPYKKLGLKAPKESIKQADITAVIEDILTRSAKREEVARAAKKGDEVNIDFKGIDPATKEPLEGGEATDYDLILGSGSLIPGFEDNLIGLKAKDKKEFELKFPANYASEALRNKQVKFSVTLNKVSALKKAKLDDNFAKSIGKFKNLQELKADIKKQLQLERDKEYREKLSNELLANIAESSQVPVPDSLVNEEIERLEEDEKRNLVYRGQTWDEHLKAEGITAEQHREKQRPIALSRVKTGLILGVIAEQESIAVSDDELTARLNLLRSTYNDEAMRAELDKPEGKREIKSRLMIEKTIDRIIDLQ